MRALQAGSRVAIRLALAALLFTGTVSAQQTINLNSIGFANLPGDAIEIRLSFDQAPPQPSGFVLDNPARISLDLVGVASGLSQQRFNIDSNNAQSVMVLDDGARTRLVVNLDQLVNYETQISGNDLIVQVGNDTIATGVITSADPGPGGIQDAGSKQCITDIAARCQPTCSNPNVSAMGSIAHSLY